jgi:U5 small nuclear ribonucleoprotein component
LLRFGNYIGDAESDEEHHEDVQPQAFKFDEAFDVEEEEEEVNDLQLMEVDGMLTPLIHSL